MGVQLSYLHVAGIDTIYLMEFWIIAIIAVGFLGESTFGFGGGLISIPLLSTLIGVKSAVTITLLFQILMGLMIIPTYKDVHWKNFPLVAVSIAVGSIAGTYSLAIIEEELLRAILSGFIIVYLVKTFFFNYLSLPKVTTNTGAAATNAIAGWVQGIIGTSGPVFVMYLSELRLPKKEFRATIILYLFFSNILRIPASIHSGLLTKEILFDALFILPFFGLALILGHFLHHHISEQWYRYAISIILFISAITLLS